MSGSFSAAVDALHRTDEQQRSEAQAQLAALRDAPDAVERLLALATDASINATAQAHAGALLRHAVLRDWAALAPGAVPAVRDALLQRATAIEVERGARRSLMSAAAMLVKRTWFDEPALLDALLQARVPQLLAQAHPAPRIALDLCSALLEQFAYHRHTPSSSGERDNLSLEFHVAACRAFGASRHLLDVFLLTLQQSERAFAEYAARLRDDAELPPALVGFLEDAFDLLRCVLEWPFGGGDGTDADAHDEPPSAAAPLVVPVLLPASWAPALLPQLDACVQFLLAVLEAAGRDSKMSQRVRNVLERLVSIDGAFLAQAADGAVLALQMSLATRLLGAALESDRHVQSYSVLGAVEAAHSFVFVHDTRRLLAVGDERVCDFARQLALTVVASLEPEAPGVDSALRGETLELALLALAELVNEALVVPPAYEVIAGDDVATVAAPPPSQQQSVLPPAVQAAFAECAQRVVAAFCEARMRDAAAPDTWWEQVSELESDVAVFDEQLRAVGKLARVALALAGADERFWPHARQLLALLGTASADAQTTEEQVVASERAHWLLMIVTHMLCVVDQRAVPASLNWASSVAATDAADQVSLLSDALFGFFSVATHGTSPLLAQTELWSMSKWLAAYAFPVADRGLAPRLVAKFDDAGGDAALAFVVDKVALALRAFAGDPGVSAAAADALASLARLQRARAAASRSEPFLRFAAELASRPHASRQLVAAVVRLASDTPGSVAAIAAPIADGLRALTAEPSFVAQAQNAPQKAVVAAALEALRGVCSGAADGNRHDILMLFLNEPSLLALYEPLQQLFAQHEDIVALLLKGVRQFTTLASHVAHDEPCLAAICERCCAVLRRFEQSNVLAAVVRRVDEGTIGDRCSDIVALLDIVSNFAPHVSRSPAALALVCIGLGIVLPLVSDNVSIGVLNVGKVARRFYGVLFAVFESHAATVLPHMPPAQHQMLFGALQHGFAQNNADALSFAVDTVAGLAAAVDDAALAEMYTTLLFGMLSNEVTLAPAVIASAGTALRGASPAVLAQVCERTVALAVARAPPEQAASVEARLTLALQELFGDTPLEQTSFFAQRSGLDAATAQLMRVRLRYFLLHVRSFANFT